VKIALFLALSVAGMAAILHAEPMPDAARVEEVAKAQVFLDRAGFGPGKIDGRDGQFTRKALELYKLSQGQEASAGDTLDLSGLDTSAGGPVFVSYTVTEADLENVGELPEQVEAQGKLKWLPYRTAAEAIAEKFHCDVDFLEERNPGRTAQIKVGDQLMVPNVEPMDFAELKKSVKEAKSPDDPAKAISIIVQTQASVVEIYDGSQLVAAFPVTLGSDRTESPVGEWKVKGVARLPEFRYDEKMLNEGKRSGDFVMLPPGPNNPVGVMWIALNRDGIGLHGANEPDLIGRSQSHGCVRLANWDVVRLAKFVEHGTPVAIR
jgi:lipoprotein-anchoring transpeptidase ErfK/SrfK